MEPQFHETGYGKKFFEHQLPELILHLCRIADAMDIKKRNITPTNLEEAYRDIQNKLMTHIDEWFGNLPGASKGKITGYNPDDYPASHKLTDEEEGKELTRDDAVDLGWDVWHNFSVEEKIDWKEIIESKQEGL